MLADHTVLRDGAATMVTRCAVMTRGCPAWLTIPVPAGTTGIEHLDSGDPRDRYVAAMLALNGWSQDRGRWVCPAHDRR
jgi:hypothetical protein